MKRARDSEASPEDVRAALAPTEADLRAAARVLHEVFSLARFADERYLRWFYRENPVGAALEVTRIEGGACLGHLAGIPQVYERAGQSLPFVFPLNIAVSESARGRGLMTRMSLACFAAARERYGDGGLVGMPNAASTPCYTATLGFRLVRPLPVRLCPAAWVTRAPVMSVWADADYLSSRDFLALVQSLDLTPGPGWKQRWNHELLSWRLRAPGARYAIHAGPDVAIVTSVTRRGSVPFTIVLKTFARGPHRGTTANGVIAAACRFHRTPLALYAGFSSAARVFGVPLPDRLKPSPLNLIVRSMRPGFFDEATFEFEAMEFFDFDAY